MRAAVELFSRGSRIRRVIAGNICVMPELNVVNARVLLINARVYNTVKSQKYWSII